MTIATSELAMLLRGLSSLVAPASVALVAFLLTRATGTLVDAAVTPASIAPFAEARAAAGDAGVETVALEAVPACESLRAVASVRDGAALVTRAAGPSPAHDATPDGMRIVRVDGGRVWLEVDGVLCQARLFAGPPLPATGRYGLSSRKASTAEQRRSMPSTTRSTGTLV